MNIKKQDNTERSDQKKELEELQEEISKELKKIAQIKKTINSLTKQTKPDKIQNQKLEAVEYKTVRFKKDTTNNLVKENNTITSSNTEAGKESLMNQSSNKLVDKPTPNKTAFTLDESLNLVSYANKNTNDGSSASLFNEKLLAALNLNKFSSFNDLIISLKRTIEDDQIEPNSIYKLLSRNILLKYIDKLSESKGLTSTYKEKISEMLLIYSTSVLQDSMIHPSLMKVVDYLSEENLACGINYAKSVQGFDHVIINVEAGVGFKKLTFIDFIELKYRYKNQLSWQVPSQTYNPRVFELSVAEILTEKRAIGAYVIDSYGDIVFDAKSSFGRFLSETRGNGVIIKMEQWSDQIDEIAKIWKNLPQNSGKEFPLHEIVPNSSGKTLQKCLEEAMLEQFRLEALAESEFIINYEGSLLAKYFSKPLQKWEFQLFSNNRILKKEIEGKDFRVNDSLRDDTKFTVLHPNFPNGLEIQEYLTFPLIENNELLYFLNFNPKRYRIYLSDAVNEIIICDKEIIVCSHRYYKIFKQYLCGEIKTRFVNDIRDSIKLLGWKDIVADNFKFQHSLSFITSNPIPKDYFDKYSGEYRFHSNLHKLKADHHILGVDNVSCYALRPSTNVKDNINSKWYRRLDTNFHKGLIPSHSLNISTNLKEPFLDLSKTYGHNIPNPEWEGYGMITVNSFLASGKYRVEPEYLMQLEIASKELMNGLPKPYDPQSVIQYYDIYSESNNLFSRNNIYTTKDYTKSISNQAKREITNEIRAEFLSKQTFDGVTDEIELLVTLIRRNGKTKKLVRDEEDILIMDFTIMVHRDQINYFPMIRKFKNKSAGSSRYRFEIHTSSSYVLQSVRNNLLDCPWISDDGQLDIENRFDHWKERLAKANSGFVKKKKTIQVSLNAFEALWLLICTVRNMNEIENELFTQFLNSYSYLKATRHPNEDLLLWTADNGELTLENFRKYYSFGIMGFSMKRYKNRIIYEVMSNEFKDFIDKVYSKCMQLLMYCGKKPYLKWVRNFMEELGKVIY